ncbi:MAG: hypothetical protein JWQ81_5627 [Amycolatopsis sp.]|uniref:hypothetical protein n=1 Tax=Amycolatopsis sp. TaxID=37632 RepID=UPI002631CC30|nr:hypothetical protein [Amycolatopsis sp.]MCU1684888.1 hypothetical protein [Amycolatopsis sp.]
MTNTVKLRYGFAVAGIALVGLVSACGGGGDGGNKVASAGGDTGKQSASAKPSPQDQALAWAQCMRKNGVAVPDPKPGSDGTIMLPAGGQGADQAALEKATDACKALMPSIGGEGNKLDAKQLDEQLATAKCMRAHGVPMSDPTPDSPSTMDASAAGDMSKVEAAAKACGMKGIPVVKAAPAK